MIRAGDIQSIIDPHAVGRRVRECRKARGWRLIDLQAKSGVDEGYISAIENGKRGVSLRCAVALSLAFNRPLAWMLCGHRSLKTAWTRTKANTP